MIYGNKFLNETAISNTDKEINELLESMRQDLLNEDYKILQESLKDKISKFFNLFKKKQKEETIKIGQAETVLKMDISKVKLSKKTIVFDKPKVIDELNWYGFIFAIGNGINIEESRKIAMELFNKKYDDITEKDIDKLTQFRSIMFPRIVIRTNQVQINERLTNRTDYDTFIKEFDDLFKEKTQREMGLYTTKEFKNSDEVNEYISGIENVQRDIDGMSKQFLELVNIILRKLNDVLEEMDMDDKDVVLETDPPAIRHLRLSIETLSDMFNAFMRMETNVSNYAVRALKYEQANVKKLDYTGKIK